MKKDPEQVYQERISQCDTQLERLKKIEILLSSIKLILTLGGIFILYRITIAYKEIHIGALFICMILFTITAVIHEHFIRKRNFIRMLKKVNEEEIKALSHYFPFYDNGKNFIDFDHDYTSDLDLFGEKSVFHFINRAVTGVGIKRLAQWIKRAPGIVAAKTILKHQDAAQELGDRIELRQNIQVYGKSIKERLQDLDELELLLNEPYSILKKRILLINIHVMPIVTLILIGLIFKGLFWGFPAVSFLFHLGVNRFCTKKNDRIYNLSLRLSRILRSYSKILEEIETKDYRSEELLDIKNICLFKNQTASAYIKRLSNIVSFFELRRNEILHPLFNSLFFWDLHCVFRIEKWRKEAAEQVGGWLDAMGRFEALSSFANIYFNHPDWTFPVVQVDTFVLEAKEIGHFLIPSGERVNNDMTLDQKKRILMVTGPNMAGKSTFLKTIGINLVLALAGAPVCAKKMVVSPVKLYSSMKVSDSLDKSLSLFYAELVRLKKILDGINKNEKVFFLLDEMLKGTNALDRQMGAIALLRQFTGMEASGIVATHDLELANLEDEYPDRINNYHFDGYVEGEKLLFDYKLKKGKCKSFNALILMRKIGIDV